MTESKMPENIHIDPKIWGSDVKVTMDKSMYDALIAKNARLVEVLERISSGNVKPYKGAYGELAKQALAENKE
jgi:hypothetical protein